MKPNQMQKNHEILILEDSQSHKQKARVNSHGFSSPLTFFQILPIIFIILMYLETAYLVSVVRHTASKVSISLISFILLIAIGILWYVTSKINPSDTIYLFHHTAKQKGEYFDTSDYKYFCKSCQTCVSKNAFHCRKCNRCVEVFDHHCKWLNNCIGAKNYFQFFTLISCTEALLIFHIVINLSTCVSHSIQKQQFSWFFSMTIIFSLLDFIIFGFNTSLLGIHIYLILNKKTTLELIISKRASNKIHPETLIKEEKNQCLAVQAKRDQGSDKESDSSQSFVKDEKSSFNLQSRDETKEDLKKLVEKATTIKLSQTKKKLQLILK